MRKFFTFISLLFLIAIIGCAGKEITRDDRFIANDNGVVKDTETGLEWFPGPDKDTNWDNAKKRVENLTVAGGGWRMPTRQELKNLYKKGAGERNMTPLLKTTGWWVWSGETKDSSTYWIFSFAIGDGAWYRHNLSTSSRGFAVRSRR